MCPYPLRRHLMPADDVAAVDPQSRAADPRDSVWVEASAGTGKTSTLVKRLLRLLLAGAEPQRILCLTYTRAAAAEMANRVQIRLAQWMVMADDDLRASVAEEMGQPPESLPPPLLEHARGLFVAVGDRPGGLRLQTIHAYCQSVLARFPVEGGVPPGARVLDEAQAARLLRQARDSILAQGAADEATVSTLQQALRLLIAHLDEAGIDDALGQLIENKDQFAGMIAEHGDIAGLVAEYGVRLESLGEVPSLGTAVFAGLPATTRSALLSAAAALAASDKPSDQATAERLRALTEDASAWATDPAVVERYRSAFLTDKGELRKRLATANVVKRHPDLPALMSAEATRLQDLQTQHAQTLTHAVTAALLFTGHHILAAFERLKASRLLLDYDDLITRTARLFNSSMVPWVRYKLDGGVDHLLVDEAQDTSPAQWQVIKAMIEDLFMVDRDRPAGRSVFVVGDRKQSIYSFQGADVATFAATHQWLGSSARQMERRFTTVALDTNYRSAPEILGFVDAVFSDPAVHADVSRHPPRHNAHRRDTPGRVILWPAVPAAPRTPAEPWVLPHEALDKVRPMQQLGWAVAAQIKAWLDGGERLATGAPIRAGDIMVLVRRRAGFVPPFLRACARLGVPVTGADRLHFASEIAVKDVLAVIKAALLPEDDLTLATVLKSPFVGIDEDTLCALSRARGEARSFWQTLQSDGAAAPSSPGAFAATVAWIQRLADRAGDATPYDMLRLILQTPCPAEPLGAEAALLARFGPEVGALLGEFLGEALRFEATEAPLLESFVAMVESSEKTIKRDMQHGVDKVRVLTVHAAKGLEAPVVILPDTASIPTEHDRLLFPDRPAAGAEALPLFSGTPDDAAGTQKLPLYRVPNIKDAAVEARLQARAARRLGEYRRLLYVALTRARDRLLICGAPTPKDSTPETPQAWYDLCAAGMARMDEAETRPLDLGALMASVGTPRAEALGWDGPMTVLGPMPLAAAAAPSLSSLALPSPAPPSHAEGLLPVVNWIQAPRRPAEIRQTLRPSAGLSEEEPAVISPLAEADTWRFERGLLAHFLFQVLPDHPPAQRPTIGRTWLRRRAPTRDEAMREEILREVLAVLNDAAFAPVFAPGSRAEVRLVGEVDGKRLSGQIDRLCVTETDVLVVDYKTNRQPARTVAEVPALYRQQLGAYRRMLAPLYPGRLIRTALLWTVVPDLMALEEEVQER